MPYAIQMLKDGYLRLCWRRANTESLRFWTEHRIFALIVFPLIAISIEVYRQWRSLLVSVMAIVNVIGLTAISFMAMIVLRFAFDLLAAPSRIYRDDQQEIAKLNTIAFPPISPEEARRRKIVADVFARDQVTNEQKMVLRFILDHGRIRDLTLDEHGTRQGSGFSYSDVNRIIVVGTTSSLLHYTGDIISINPEFNSAIDHHLSSEGL